MYFQQNSQFYYVFILAIISIIIYFYTSDNSGQSEMSSNKILYTTIDLPSIILLV